MGNIANSSFYCTDLPVQDDVSPSERRRKVFQQRDFNQKHLGVPFISQESSVTQEYSEFDINENKTIVEETKIESLADPRFVIDDQIHDDHRKTL